MARSIATHGALAFLFVLPHLARAVGGRNPDLSASRVHVGGESVSGVYRPVLSVNAREGLWISPETRGSSTSDGRPA